MSKIQEGGGGELERVLDNAEILRLSSKQTGVNFSCVCPVINHKFRHNIVKVAVDPRSDSRVDQQTTLTMF